MKRAITLILIAMLLSATSFAIVGPISGITTLCTGRGTALSDTTMSGVWSSTNTSVAVISPTGFVTGMAAGTSVISYTVGASFAITTVTVNASPAAITGSSAVCVGATIPLSDATPGGSWSSSNTSATVNSTGLVTGMSTGGIAIISYTLPTGCFAIKSVSVISLSTPITGPSAVCTGSSISLTDATPGGTWQSGNTSLATVNASGIVTGVASGVVNIYYSISGCGALKTITVVTATTPITGASTVCAGLSIILTDATGGGSWSSANTSVAVVNSAGIVTGVAAGTATISYSIGSCSSSRVVTVTPGAAAISGPSTVCAGSAISLSDATPGGSWSSFSSTVATVNSTGLVSGVSVGVTLISYTLSTGCFTTKSITVTTLTTPITGPSAVCAGSSITLSDASVGGTWQSGNTAVATVNTSTGIVTGTAPGVVNIYYSVSGCAAFTTVTVVTATAPITGPSVVCTGLVISLSDATSGGSWSSSNTSASVNTSGFVIGLAPGVVNISYSIGSCTSVKTITVTPGAAAITGPATVCVGSTILLTDATPGGTWSSFGTATATVSGTGLVSGMSVGVTLISYTLSTGCFAIRNVTVTAGPAAITGLSSACIGGTIALSDATSGGSWISSNSSIATINSTGVVTGIAVGTATISYYAGGCISSKVITITAGPAAISGPSTVCIGSSILLTDATSGGSWTSSNSTVASVSGTGMVTGVSSGVCIITYSLSTGCYALKLVSVTTLTTPITGGSSVCVGSTLALSDATPAGIWQSGNTAIATVNSSGIVTAVAAGVVNIYYSVSGCGAVRTVTVVGTVKPITGPSVVCIGSSVSLSDSTSGGAWLSSNTSIATISSSGVVTGVSTGVVNIYYIIGSCAVSKTVTVTTGPSAIGGPSTVCVGSTITLSDATSGGTWSSSATSLATVGVSTGIVTGVAGGVVTIYYTVGACSASKTVTVTTITTPISGPSTVCTGSSIILSDATPAGVWISGTPTVAIISPTGVLTGVSAGVVNIYYFVGGCGASKTITVTPTPKPIIGASVVCTGATISLSDSTIGGAWLSGNPAIATISSTGVVTGIGTGVVNIYYTLGSCGAYKTFTVTTVAAISGPSTVCVGAVIVLSDATTGGTWSSSNTAIATVSTGAVTGISAGVVTITYKAGGCMSTKSVTVSPSPSAIGGPSTVVAGSVITLSDAVSGGTWLTSSTSLATITSGGVVTGVNAGVVNIYYIIGSCAAYRTVTVTPHGSSFALPATTGIAGIVAADNGGTISIFPNPTNGNINIKWDGQATGTADMQISDITGRVVLRTTIDMNSDSGQTGLSLSDLNAGIYLISVRSENTNYTSKIIIQK